MTHRDLPETLRELPMAHRLPQTLRELLVTHRLPQTFRDLDDDAQILIDARTPVTSTVLCIDDFRQLLARLETDIVLLGAKMNLSGDDDEFPPRD